MLFWLMGYDLIYKALIGLYGWQIRVSGDFGTRVTRLGSEKLLVVNESR